MYLARLLMLLAVLPLLTKTASGAEASLIVTGIVVDPAGGPFPNGAKVELVLVDDKGRETIVSSIMTDSDGAFQLAGSHRGVYRVKFTHGKKKVVVIALGKRALGSKVDVGVIKIEISCSDPGIICDEIKPLEK
jgi:hypothetical protein